MNFQTRINSTILQKLITTTTSNLIFFIFTLYAFTTRKFPKNHNRVSPLTQLQQIQTSNLTNHPPRREPYSLTSNQATGLSTIPWSVERRQSSWIKHSPAIKYPDLLSFKWVFNLNFYSLRRIRVDWKDESVMYGRENRVEVVDDRGRCDFASKLLTFLRVGDSTGPLGEKRLRLLSCNRTTSFERYSDSWKYLNIYRNFSYISIIYKKFHWHYWLFTTNIH